MQHCSNKTRLKQAKYTRQSAWSSEIGCSPFTNDFFLSKRPGYPHPVCSELEIVVSEWRSVIAVSLNVGGGVRLIKPEKLYTCTQTCYKHDEDGRTAPCVCGHGNVPPSHSRNVVTRIGLHVHIQSDFTIVP